MTRPTWSPGRPAPRCTRGSGTRPWATCSTGRCRAPPPRTPGSLVPRDALPRGSFSICQNRKSALSAEAPAAPSPRRSAAGDPMSVVQEWRGGSPGVAAGQTDDGRSVWALSLTARPCPWAPRLRRRRCGSGPLWRRAPPSSAPQARLLALLPGRSWACGCGSEQPQRPSQRGGPPPKTRPPSRQCCPPLTPHSDLLGLGGSGGGGVTPGWLRGGCGWLLGGPPS